MALCADPHRLACSNPVLTDGMVCDSCHTHTPSWRDWHPARSYPRLTKAELEAKRADCKRGVLELHKREVARRRGLDTLAHYKGITADHVAEHLGVMPAQRHGNGAVEGSWSGYMKPGLRVTKMLQALVAAGELGGEYRTGDEYRWYFWPVGEEPWLL